jgi:hypothetical protein
MRIARVLVPALALAACSRPAAESRRDTPAATATAPAGSKESAGRRAASTGDTVLIVLNYVKADKRQQFERFLHETFWPGGKRVGATDSVIAATFRDTRILHPAQANKDGTLTYAFVMDPYHSAADYEIGTLLKRAYPAAEADRYMVEFNGSLARPATLHWLVQSPD